MPQKPKAKSPTPEPKKKAPEEASIVEDQNSRGYYYDDAHGYETYLPGDDNENDAEEEFEKAHKASKALPDLKRS